MIALISDSERLMKLNTTVRSLALCFALATVAPVAFGAEVARYALSGNLSDITGFNHGVFQGTGGTYAAPTFIADSQFGSVLDFDGTDDRISLGNVHTFQNNSWSISMWVKTQPTANVVPLIGKNNGDNSFAAGERVYEITGNGTWANIIDPELPGNLAVNAHSHGGVVTNQSLPLDDGAWHMLTMVHNNSISATHHNLYIDGVLQPLGSQTMNNNSVADVGGFFLGFANGSGSGAGGYFKGQMAEVTFYNHAIAQSDVDQLLSLSTDTFVGGDGVLGSASLSTVVTGATLQGQAGVQVVRVSRTRPGDTNNFLSLRELEAIDDNGVNVALATNGGVPQYSSLWNDPPGTIHPITAINDGITNNLGDNGHAHTGNPPTASTVWLQVVLDGEHTIDTVRLYNRGNCCADQAQGVDIQFYSDAAATNLIGSMTGVSVDGGPGASKSFDVRKSVGGTATAELSATRVYHMEIDADSLLSDLFVVPQGTADSTALVLAGDLVVELAAGTLNVGDSFKLFDADTFSGAFDSLTLPGGPSVWDVSDLATTGEIHYVPEPTSLGLLVVGLLAGVGLRRRRC
jgi:hypothetical protein